MPDSVDPRETAQRWISANTDLRDPEISTSAVRGTTSTTFWITAAGSESFVLKLYDAPGLVEAIPDIAEREALGLQLAGKALGALVPTVVVATPRASDGLPPGLLMTAVQGTDNVLATQLDGPLGVMACLHEASCAGLPGLYPPWAASAATARTRQRWKSRTCWLSQRVHMVPCVTTVRTSSTTAESATLKRLSASARISQPGSSWPER